MAPYHGGVTFTQDGDYFGNYPDEERQLREMARHSPRDASAHARFETDVMKQTRLIRQFLLKTPPDPTSFKPRDLKGLLELAAAFTELGEEGLFDTLRF